MYKILIIIPYYGRLKNYFNTFVESVRGNASVDWLLMTDDKTQYHFPANMKVIYNDFETLKNIVQSKFDFDICLDTPYKLCDYKPAYGYIFSDYLRGYDFWGFCDIDMVFGNIRKFVTDDVLKKHTRVFQHGHFSLFRNTEEWNTLFMKANGLIGHKRFADYREVFSSAQIFYFDEYNPNRKDGTAEMWKILYPDRIYLGTPMDNIRWPAANYYSFRSTNNAKGHFVIFEYKESTLFRVYIEKDTIIREETLYAHFHLWKIKECLLHDSNFIVVPGRILPFTNITDDFIKKHTRKHYLKLFFVKTLAKIRKITNGRK